MATQAYFENIKEQIIIRIENANKSIRIAVALFTDNDLFEILCKKASDGVRVELLIANHIINHNCGLEYGRLSMSGGKVHLIGSGIDSDPIMNHKFCIIDSKILIFGSYTWVYKAVSNYENITIIEGDTDIILAYNDEYEKIRYYHSNSIIPNILPIEKKPSLFNKIAKQYYMLGLNVTCIGDTKNEFNKKENVLLKSPNHKWENFINERQTEGELSSYDWNSAIGLGLVLGFQKLRALDIDGCDDFELVSEFLKLLELPSDYEWVVKTISGFHIIFYCENHNYYDPYSGKLYKNVSFKPIGNIRLLELRWEGHLVLPPTTNNKKNYHFIYHNTIPKQNPSKVLFENVVKIVQKVSFFNSIEDEIERYRKFYEKNIIEEPEKKEENLFILNELRYAFSKDYSNFSYAH